MATRELHSEIPGGLELTAELTFRILRKAPHGSRAHK